MMAAEVDMSPFGEDALTTTAPTPPSAEAPLTMDTPQRTTITDRDTSSVSTSEEGQTRNINTKVTVNGGKSFSNDSSSTSLGPELPDWYTKLNVDNKSLEDQSNIFSLWTLSYLSPLLRLGATKVIEQSDIGVTSKCDRSDLIFQTIDRSWQAEVARVRLLNSRRLARYNAKYGKLSEEEKKKKKVPPFSELDPSILSALCKGFSRFKIALGIFYYVVSALLGFVPIIILNDLINYFGPERSTKYANPWVEVAALGVVPFIISLLQTRSQVIFQHCSIFVRTATSTMLYRKSLLISAAGRAVTSTGQVVNMMSNDTTQLQRFIQFAGMTFVSPLQIVLSLALIYQQVGNATWVGVGYMLFLAPINIIVFSVVGKMRRRVLKFSDMRVKMMNEILTGIRIIKFYAWEKPFQKEIGKIRSSELEALTKLAYVSAVGFSMLLLSAPIVQPILVFLTYINIQDVQLNPATAFTTVALFNIMRFPFAFLPMGLLQFIQSRIALHRLAKYLLLPELDKYVLPSPHPDNFETPDSPGSKVGSITMKHSSFSWTNKNAKLTPIDGRSKKKERRDSQASRRRSSLQGASAHSAGPHSAVDTDDVAPADVITINDVSCIIEAEKLVAVVGTVGSGKSSFLSAILGDMEPVQDSKVYMPRATEEKNRSNLVAYCSQTPWVVNDTLMGNIVFGREFNQERYDTVVKACALLDDLAILPAGDKTEIGERGINLSGGQKARVSLARAMYSEQTKILLLDDPLSAVDAHVGEHLFNEAITGEISKGRTRVLVTHHVHFLPRCDKVIVLEEGRIAHYDTYLNLAAQGVDFAGATEAGKEEKDESAGLAEASHSEEVKDVVDTAPIAIVKDEGLSEDYQAVEKDKALMKAKGEKLVSVEEREEGAVDGQSYLHYARAGGIILFSSLFVIQGVGRASEVMGSFWLAIWADKSASGPLSKKDTTAYLNVYAAFGMFGVICLTVRAIVMALHRLNASRRLHNDLSASILRAPVSFFDITPTGRILNRFAADMDKIDLDLTQSIGQGLGTTFSVLGAIGGIIAATKGTFLVPLLPISIIYYYIQKWFRKTSTELQRVTSIAASPIFSDFSQVLSGTSTIRAYDEEKRFFIQCQKSFNNCNASYNLVQLCSFWLGLRLDCIGGLIGAFVGGVSVATASTGFIPAGWFGLALSYSIEITGYLKLGVRMIATIEADMNSVDRVLYYSNEIESEAPDEIPGKDPNSKNWPVTGQIQINNASMRYRDGPLVLKDISLTVNGGEKIGVVGRTGSGKSSLMNLLFRITELERDGGNVVIDGVNTSEIGTAVLRSNLSIIPQDPIMFSNSVRYNLDPFGNSTETEIWNTLKKVQLAEVIAGLPGGLDDEVFEQGENFSQGQRQLLCIARSLLRNPKILIMDEATASIDNTTDNAIQKMIRENFANATVLTIAHRLNTIMDNDRVLVLDDGRIAEFDSPKNLLAKPHGKFRAMVDKSKAAHNEDA